MRRKDTPNKTLNARLAMKTTWIKNLFTHEITLETFYSKLRIINWSQVYIIAKITLDAWTIMKVLLSRNLPGKKNWAETCTNFWEVGLFDKMFWENIKFQAACIGYLLPGVKYFYRYVWDTSLKVTCRKVDYLAVKPTLTNRSTVLPKTNRLEVYACCCLNTLLPNNLHWRFSYTYLQAILLLWFLLSMYYNTYLQVLNISSVDYLHMPKIYNKFVRWVSRLT